MHSAKKSYLLLVILNHEHREHTAVSSFDEYDRERSADNTKRNGNFIIWGPCSPCPFSSSTMYSRRTLDEGTNADKTGLVLLRAAKNSSIVAGNGTFFSDSPDDVSPADAIKGTYLDCRHNKERSEVAKGPMPSVSKRPPSREVPNADIAPWMDDGLPALSTHGLTSSSFFSGGSSKAQRSPSFRPDSGRTADSESPDPMFLSNGRRPSLASATTIDSQSSLSKTSTSRGTPYKKVAGFFGDEGRQSPRSSDTSIPSTLQREQTVSSRHGSRHASRDEGRPISPSSSRPRTPLPSSDVVPWLFQDFKVGIDICVFVKQSAYTRLLTETALSSPYQSSSSNMRSVLTVLASV